MKKFYPLIRVCSVLRPESWMSLIHRIKAMFHMQMMCNMFMTDCDFLWIKVFFLTECLIIMTFTPLHVFLPVQKGLSNQLSPSVCLPVCPSSDHLHMLTPTHLLFCISNEIQRSHIRGSPRPLIPNIISICLHFILVFSCWLWGNSLWDWANARESLRWLTFFFFFFLSHSSPLGHTFITHDRIRRSRRRQ